MILVYANTVLFILLFNSSVNNLFDFTLDFPKGCLKNWHMYMIDLFNISGKLNILSK